MPAEALIDAGPKLTSDSYLHANYHFVLDRRNMHREGTGELWLSFAGGTAHMRLRGVARSPRFGDGEITIVVDGAARQMYALFKLGELHEAQCITYPFPSPADNPSRMDTLRRRLSQVQAWQAKEASQWAAGSRLVSLNWTSSYTLDFLLSSAGDAVDGVDLRQGERIVKTVRFLGVPERSSTVPEDAAGLFTAPAGVCTPAADVADPMAQVELRPPHRKSSALNDLLLALGGLQDQADGPHLFIMLSALTVPGDVAVLIEDPEPPHPELLGGIAFDYTATVTRQGMKHSSDGAIWLNVQDRSFYLHGEALETKVGPLFLDLVARGGEDASIYANVNLTAQNEQQCVAYDFPNLTVSNEKELQDLARQPLKFFTIASLRDEDCGIFTAPLARGRWIHIWVDMEADNPNAILRTEIHKEGQVLRSTDVLGWRTGQMVQVAAIRPLAAWGCSNGPEAGQVAHLGLRQVHKRSIELQDALYALQSLPASFAVLEVLGLTGDVAIMVQEPEVPELWRLPTVSLAYSLFSGPATGPGSSPTFLSGTFAADTQQGKIRLTAWSTTPTAGNMSVAVEPTSISVWREGAEPSCLTLPLQESLEVGAARSAPAVSLGIFEGVDAVGNTVCNHFTFPGFGNRVDSIGLWFSQEEDALCRLQVLPPDGSGEGAVIDVPFWRPEYLPGAREGGDAALAAAPADWKCSPAAEVPSPWASLAAPAQPHHTMGAALSKLAEAAGAVGLISPQMAGALSQLHVDTVDVPQVRPATSATVGLFSEELRSFTFSFTSTFPVQGQHSPVDAGAGTRSAAPRHRGRGELRVDLAKRRFFLRSEADSISSGIARVESRVIFRGDRGRLYARTKIDADNFAQCWSVRTVEAVPAPRGGAQPNPFVRGKLVGNGFSVPGAGDRQMDKYTFFLDPKKRVALFVDAASALAAINVDDLAHDVSVGVLINDWSTDPIDDAWFEPGTEWNCHDQQFLEHAGQLAAWDLIRVFFPAELVPTLGEPAAPAEAAERRLSV